MKANPARLVRAHYRTLVDARTGRLRPLDYLAFWGIPLCAFVASWVPGVSLPQSANAGLLTVSGLMAAFFFGAMLQVSMRAMTWADSQPPPGPDVSRHAEFLKQIAANAGYASLACLATAVVFVVGTASPNTRPVMISSVGIALATHVVLMLGMVLARLFALAEQRLTDARTGGGSVTQLPERRRANGM
jgi:hypothetical protein